MDRSRTRPDHFVRKNKPGVFEDLWDACSCSLLAGLAIDAASPVFRLNLARGAGAAEIRCEPGKERRAPARYKAEERANRCAVPFRSPLKTVTSAAAARARSLPHRSSSLFRQGHVKSELVENVRIAPFGQVAILLRRQCALLRRRSRSASLTVVRAEMVRSADAECRCEGPTGPGLPAGSASGPETGRDGLTLRPLMSERAQSRAANARQASTRSGFLRLPSGFR